MADLFETKSGVTYLALSDQEKQHIYEQGEKLRKELERKPPGVPDWCEHDWNSLTIPQLCAPFEEGGEFLDLQLSQVNKYNKTMLKLFGETFLEVFEIDLTGDYLDAQEVRERMVRLRNQKQEYKVLKNDKYIYNETEKSANGTSH